VRVASSILPINEYDFSNAERGKFFKSNASALTYHIATSNNKNTQIPALCWRTELVFLLKTEYKQ